MPDNIYSNIPQRLPDELFEILLQKPGVTIERIISKGHCSPEHLWYDQAWDEWVILLQGQAILRFDDNRKVSLRPGDYLLIPAHQRHQVSQTDPDSDTIWLAIHFR